MGVFSNTVVSNFKDESFDIIQAFSKLDSTRKMALFDRLNGSSRTFYNTVNLLWPSANDSDCKKLEKFLVDYMSSHGVKERA